MCDWVQASGQEGTRLESLAVVLLYARNFSIYHCTHFKIVWEGERWDCVSQETCLKLLPIITRNDKWSGKLSFFLYPFYKERFPIYHAHTAAAKVIVKIALFSCDWKLRCSVMLHLFLQEVIKWEEGSPYGEQNQEIRLQSHRIKKSEDRKNGRQIRAAGRLVREPSETTPNCGGLSCRNM